MDDTKDLLFFILQGCQTDFFFAHRIWFFFYSSMFENYSHSTYLSTRKVLKGLKRALLSTDAEDSGACFCLANDSDIVHFLVDLDLIELYPWLHQNPIVSRLLTLQSQSQKLQKFNMTERENCK